MTNNSSSWGYLLDVRNPHGFWRFAGNKATSQWVVVPIMGFLSLNALVTAALSPPSEQLQVLSAAVIAFATAWVFFTFTALIVNLVFSRFGTSRIIAILVMYGLTEYIRISMVHQVITSSIMLGENSDLYTFVGAVVTGIVMCSIAATATFDSSLYKTDYTELVQQQRALSSTVLSTEKSVEQVRSQLLHSTKVFLTSSLDTAFENTKSDRKNYSQLVDDLFRISDEVIRPLSFELSESIRVEKKQVPPLEPQKLSLRTVLSHFNRFSSFYPIQFTVIIALISSPGLILVPHLGDIVGWSATVIIVYLAHYLSKKFIAPTSTGFPLIVRGIINSFVYALPVGLLFLVVTLNVPALEGLGFFIFVYGCLVGLVLGWLIGLSDGFRSARAEVLQQLVEANDQLLWLETRLQSQLWLDQKRLALVVHNDVQATILSAGLSLKKAIQSGEEEVKKKLPTLRKMIFTSLQLDHRENTFTCIEDVVKELNETWHSLISMSLFVQPNASALINHDSLASEVCSEIIREFMTNSLKHGQASTVTVDIDLKGENILALTFQNNGKALTRTKSQSGLGTSFLDAVSLSFTLSDVPGGVQLYVEVPVATSSEYRRVAA